MESCGESLIVNRFMDLTRECELSRPFPLRGGISDGGDQMLFLNDLKLRQQLCSIILTEKIVFTWNSAIVTNSIVTVELKDLGESTEVWITHDRLETLELRDMHTFGWEGCVGNLLAFMEA